MKFKNKVVNFAGASSGIGKAIMLAFDEEGVAVAIDYRSPSDEAKEVIKQIEGIGRG